MLLALLRFGGPVGERLDSWKEIAAYLGRDVRTVQRWERGRRLVVHRVPGGTKARVYGLKSELDAWLGAAAAEAPRSASVAVLPFSNLTEGKENEYFADGLADEIITALTRVPGLRVTARTSSFAFRGKEEDARKIGARLGARALLEGSVRRSGDRVRVAAQLIDAETGYHLWSDRYDGSIGDIFAIQDGIARAIVRALRARLAPGVLVERSTDDVEAYRLWLEGRHAAEGFTPDGIARARRCYAAATERDPQFSLPYLSTAELLFEGAQVGFLPPAEAATDAKDAALKALALNETLGEAHAIVGVLHGVLEYEWGAAEEAFRRALELNPGSASMLMRYAWFHLVPRRRITEAVNHMGRAATCDPLSPWVHARFGLVWTVAREYGRALEEHRIAVELAPTVVLFRWLLGYTLILVGRADEGLAECLKVYERREWTPLVTAGMSVVYGMLGRDDDARRMLSELLEAARTTWVPPLAFAWAYAGTRDERVFEWLDKAIAARDPAVTHMPSMPYYDAIRNDPRFRLLLAKMRLA